MVRGFSLALVLSVAASGCDLGPDEYIPGTDPVEPPVMRGFSWVIDGQLAGMPRPGGRAPLAEDLDFIADQGVDLLVSLVEEGTVAAAAPGHGLEVLHLPVRDFTAPTLMQLREFAVAAHAAIDAGRQVGVHCGAGLGRTGTFLSAYFVTTGMTADEAIAHVRALRPGSVETSAQIKIVRDYERWTLAGPGASSSDVRP